MVHSHTVHLPLGALLSPCTVCGTGHAELEKVVETWEETAEMRFGSWDNVKVKDLEALA